MAFGRALWIGPKGQLLLGSLYLHTCYQQSHSGHNLVLCSVSDLFISLLVWVVDAPLASLIVPYLRLIPAVV